MNDNENNNGELNTISLGSIPDNANNVNVPLSSIPPVKPLEPVAPIDLTPPAPEAPEAPVAPIEEVPKIENSNPSTPKIEDIATPVLEPQEVAQPLEENNPFQNVDIPPIFDNIGTVPPPQVEAVAPVAPISPVEPVNYDVPNAINDMPTAPIFNDIGTVPPIPEAPILTEAPKSKHKNKKPVNKTIFVLIIVLVIAAIGVAVYVLLGISGKKVNGGSSPIILKEVNIELGGEISTNINEYATFKGISSNNCSLNTSKIGSELNETYPFIITCNGINYEGKAKVIDTTSPEVITKEVTTSINSEIKPADFIESCTDATECSFEFKDETAVKELLKTVGIYKNQVVIIAKDTTGNQKEINASLIVSDKEASVYLVCTKNNSTSKEIDRIGLDNGNLVGKINREHTFTFANEELYKTAKKEATDGSEMTYQNISGKVTFDDANFQFTITKYLTFEEFKQEAGTNLSSAFLDISAYYGTKGYSCELK